MGKKDFKLKVAKEYTRFFTEYIPINAVYGRVGNIAFYIKDFEEYRKTMKYRTIYTLDLKPFKENAEHKGHFKKMVYGDSQQEKELMKMIKQFIIDNKLWNKKVESNIFLKGIEKPHLKHAQNELLYKVPHIGYVISSGENYIDRGDPTLPIRRYI